MESLGASIFRGKETVKKRGGDQVEQEKRKYYVSLEFGTHTGEIQTQKDENSPVFQYEIEATPQEVEQLEKLFAEAQETELQFFAKAHVPFLDNEAEENAEEDREINRIYQMIYQLGTEKTREQLREIGVVR
jgi:hypothetical protein